MAVYFVCAMRGVVEHFLARVRAVGQPARVKPQRIVRDAHEQMIGRRRPATVNALAMAHHELARCVAIGPRRDIARERVRI